MTYDELYGLSLEQYCERHGITIDDLIQKTKTDIDILSERLDGIGDFISHEFTTVYNALNGKRKHLSRLEEWANGE